ncbi:hemerythrin domain-containing protein [Streptacidiphilus anmyonensis]|uniref:hemerythrin domain-containing protein n=1 Tax=Streptacidiphilus anmyonensis TaxID=405782 RepID=UPI000A45D532|nr:hemerythrin domain-containing protein [Streptacidiphilus anmyonensis]
MTPSTTTRQIPAEGRPFTQEMVVVHRVFRREAALLPRLVRAVPEGDTARAGLLAAYVREYLDGLHIHHRTEDELLWPLLRARVEQGDLVARMEEQHELIDASLAAVTRQLPLWERVADRTTGDPLAAALDDHHAVLLRHLDDEERLLLPLVTDHLTVAEWSLVGKRGMEHIPKEKRLLALGAILEDATEPEAAFFLSQVPALGRLLWRVVGRRQYAAHCRELRGALRPGHGEHRP